MLVGLNSTLSVNILKWKWHWIFIPLTRTALLPNYLFFQEKYRKNTPPLCYCKTTSCFSFQTLRFVLFQILNPKCYIFFYILMVWLSELIKHIWLQTLLMKTKSLVMADWWPIWTGWQGFNCFVCFYSYFQYGEGEWYYIITSQP